MKALFLSFAILLSGSITWAASYYTNCEVKARRFPDLADNSVNQIRICMTVMQALIDEKGYEASFPLELEVTDAKEYSVNLKYSFKAHHRTVSGKGVLYWYPGDAFFVIDKK